MKVAVLKETYAGERRVALVPGTVTQLQKLGVEVIVQAGAGASAGFVDADFVKHGATIVPDREAAYQADIVVQVRSAGANKKAGLNDQQYLRPGKILIGMADPFGETDTVAEFAKLGVSLFALELIPRITRAQSMDVLSSQATVIGYRAVLLAASELPKMFPMMMTAAGTISAAKVFVIGAGVAGLQAIATAKKLGAIVHAYDIRPACREQVESLGGKFVELKIESGAAEDKGGYAMQMDEAFYQKQRELMASVVAQSDIVITTALIPGKRSPLLVTVGAVAGMAPGGVIIDLAAERGGNCELSVADQRVTTGGVTILGPTNLASDIPYHASQMYSNNVAKFLANLVKKGEANFNLEDEIIRDTLVTHRGEVVHPKIRQVLGLPTRENQTTASLS